MEINEIKEKYIKTFFEKLTTKEKQEIYFEQYMWHAFSYEKIKCINGEDAINEFAKMKKNEVYVFFEHDDVVWKEKDLTLENLFGLLKDSKEYGYDCYVVDKDFTWTFITTHETMYDDGIYHYIGPFFKRLK